MGMQFVPYTSHSISQQAIEEMEDRKGEPINKEKENKSKCTNYSSVISSLCTYQPSHYF